MELLKRLLGTGAPTPLAGDVVAMLEEQVEERRSQRHVKLVGQLVAARRLAKMTGTACAETRSVVASRMEEAERDFKEACKRRDEANYECRVDTLKVDRAHREAVREERVIEAEVLDVAPPELLAFVEELGLRVADPSCYLQTYTVNRGISLRSGRPVHESVTNYPALLEWFGRVKAGRTRARELCLHEVSDLTEELAVIESEIGPPPEAPEPPAGEDLPPPLSPNERVVRVVY